MARKRTWIDSFFGPWILRVLGVELPERPTLEVRGAGGCTVAAVDDPTTDATVLTITASGGGGGTPGGDDMQLQFNDAGAFGGTGQLIYDKNHYGAGSGAIIYQGNGHVHEEAFAQFEAGSGFAQSRWGDNQTTDGTDAPLFDVLLPAANNPDCVIKIIVEGTYVFAGGGGDFAMKAVFKRVAGTLTRVGFKDLSDSDLYFGTAIGGIDLVKFNDDTMTVHATGIASTTINWLMSFHVQLEDVPS